MHGSIDHMASGWIIWLILLLVIGWMLAGNYYRIFAARPDNPNPSNILDRRFASGEITIEEYKRFKNELASRKRGNDA